MMMTPLLMIVVTALMSTNTTEAVFRFSCCSSPPACAVSCDDRHAGLRYETAAHGIMINGCLFVCRLSICFPFPPMSIKARNKTQSYLLHVRNLVAAGGWALRQS